MDELKKRLLKYSKQNGSCLESTYKARSQSGYPLVKINGTTSGAHRISWMVHKGQIPKGKWVLHKCDNPKCINPDHLFLGTAQDNTNDMKKKGRSNYHTMKKHPQEVVEKAIELKKTGMTYKEIGNRLGISQHTVHSFMRYTSVKEKVKSFYGKKKYPDNLRKKILILKDSGMTSKKISEQEGIPKRTLTRILNKEYDED